MLEKIFKLSANKTDAKTEVLAGITTFMTMAYILAVNPNILSATGMDSGAVFTATALAAFLGTLLMAIFANYPFALLLPRNRLISVTIWKAFPRRDLIRMISRPSFKPLQRETLLPKVH